MKKMSEKYTLVNYLYIVKTVFSHFAFLWPQLVSRILAFLVSQFCKKITFYQNLATISVGLKSVAQGLLHQLQVVYYANIISYIQLSREVACKTLTHLSTYPKSLYITPATFIKKKLNASQNGYKKQKTFMNSKPGQTQPKF